MADPGESRQPHAGAAAAERLGAAFSESGMARMPARVFAAAMVDDDGRMTSAELAEFLEISPASVSGAVRMLTQLGLLRRERERGTRRDVYVVDDDAWYQAVVHRDQLYGPMIHALGVAADQVERGSLAHRRLTLAKEFLIFVQEEFGSILTRWENRKRDLGLA